MKHSSSQLYNYHKWANNEIFSHLKELPAEDYSGELKSVFPSVQAVLQHIYQTDGMLLIVMSDYYLYNIMDKIQLLKENSDNKTLADTEIIYSDLNEQFEESLVNHPDPDVDMTIHHPRYGDVTSSVS